MSTAPQPLTPYRAELFVARGESYCQTTLDSDRLAAGKLCHIDCACEHFPAAPIESIEPRTRRAR